MKEYYKNKRFLKSLNSSNNDNNKCDTFKICQTLWNVEGYCEFKLPSHFVGIFQRIETIKEVKMLIVSCSLIKKEFPLINLVMKECVKTLEKESGGVKND